MKILGLNNSGIVESVIVFFILFFGFFIFSDFDFK